MDNIKQIIEKVVDHIATNKKETQIYLQEMWLDILDKPELEHTQIIGEKEGVLSVLVDSPAWLYQMNIRKKIILEKIQREIPSVKNIHFKIGKVR